MTMTKNKFKNIGLITILFLVGCTLKQSPKDDKSPSSNFEQRFVDSLSRNQENQLFENLYESTIIDTIAVNNKKIWLLFAAKNCLDCDNGRNIYILNLNDGNKKPMEIGISATILEYETENPIYKGLIYYGNCFEVDNNVTILFVEEILDTLGKWNKSAVFYELDEEKLNKKAMDESTLMKIKTNSFKCKEVPVETEYDLP